MKDKKLTMQDIADLAGVGKSTISRYFNGGYVKEDTRQKIKKVIEKNNYEPNAFAQSLKAKKTNIIGLITPCLDSITSSRMLMAADGYLRSKGFTTIIINTNHDQNRELASIESLWRMNVDGIILLATYVTMAHRNLANKLDIPIIFVGQKLEDGISIVNDDYHAGIEVGCYVGNMNHKNIVYLGVSNRDQAVGYQRKLGVMDGLKQQGIDKVDFVETDFTFAKTREVVRDILTRKTPTMFICATDNIALATYKELMDKQIKVPKEVSLIGFGGYEVSELLTPSLCSIRFDNEKAGRLAGKIIIKIINGENVDKIHTIDYVLNIGGSVKYIE